jgi:prepilin-type N-terminal cleavage/methylation domain-containing protein
MPRATKRTVRRAGFTMVEMLVVVLIITILLSLSTAGVLALIGSQQTSNTKSELTRLQGEIEKEWNAAAHKFQTEALPPPAGSSQYNAYQVLLQMANNAPTNNLTDVTARARVLWVKMRLMQTFPQTFSEAWRPGGLFPALPYYTNQLTALGYSTTSPPSSTTVQPFESSVCLLWALQRGESNVGVKVEDLGIASSIRDFNAPAPAAGTTAKGLVDAWGQPITFCRWPTGSTALQNTATGQMGYNDPGDPTGLLTNPAWLASNSAVQFQAIFHGQPTNRQPDASGVSQPLTYRIYPVIASNGPDRKLGLNTAYPISFAPLGNGTDKDNLYATLATER